jgi:hypothetical protein
MPAVEVAATEPFRRLPAVFEQEEPEVNGTAFEQRSLAGCARAENGTINTIITLIKKVKFSRIDVRVFIGGLVVIGYWLRKLTIIVMDHQ